MFWKRKDVLNSLIVGLTRKKKKCLGDGFQFKFRIAEDVKDLEKRYNPLVGIRAGTFYEVPDARKVAKDIMLPMGYSAEVAEDCRQILAFAFLYLIYQHAFYNAYGKGTAFPSLDTALSLLSGLIKLKEQDTDDGVESVIKPKSFIKLNQLVVNISFFENHEKLPLNRYPNDNGFLHFRIIQVCYPAYSDVLLYRKTNPWLFKTAMLFLSRSKKLLAERAYMASLALQEYIDTHEDYVRYKILG